MIIIITRDDPSLIGTTSWMAQHARLWCGEEYYYSIFLWFVLRAVISTHLCFSGLFLQILFIIELMRIHMGLRDYYLNHGFAGRYLN